MGTRKGTVKSSTELLLNYSLARGRNHVWGACLQIWQHRREAVRAKVAQRMSVVRRSTNHSLND